MTLHPLRSWFPVLCLVWLLAATGCGLLSDSVVIRFEDRPRVNVGAPVILERERIGKVTSVERETAPSGQGGQGGQGAGGWTAKASIDGSRRERLRRSSIFIVDEDEGGPFLRYEIVDPASPPAERGQAFLGFNSYPDYLAWRAGRLGTRKLDEFFRILEDALRDLDAGGFPGRQPSQRF